MPPPLSSSPSSDVSTPPPSSAPTIPVRPSAASRKASAVAAAATGAPPSNPPLQSSPSSPPPVLRYEGALVNRFGVALRISTEARERGSGSREGRGGAGGGGGGAAVAAAAVSGGAKSTSAVPPPLSSASASAFPRSMDGPSSLSAPAVSDVGQGSPSPLSCPFPSTSSSVGSPPLLPTRPPRAFISPHSSPSLAASSSSVHPPLVLAAPLVPSRPASTATHHRWVTSTDHPPLPSLPATSDPRRASVETAGAISRGRESAPQRPPGRTARGGGGRPALTGLPFPSSTPPSVSASSSSSSFSHPPPSSSSHPPVASVSSTHYATLHSSTPHGGGAAPLPPSHPLSRSVSEAVDSHRTPLLQSSPFCAVAAPPPHSAASLHADESTVAPTASLPAAGAAQASSATQPSSSPTSASSPSPPSTPYAALLQQFPTSSRVRVACELADTERTYVQSLQTLVRGFIEPLTEALSERRPPLTAEQLTVVFSNAQLIHSLNSSFHSSIVTRLTSWAGLSEAEHKVGDLIAQFAPYFKVYSQYCSTFDAANKLLVDLTHSSAASSAAFQSFLSRATGTGRAPQQPPPPSLLLSSLLIQPIQRVPRYKLLLEQLIRHTPPDHPDLPLLSTALSSISVVASHINEAIRKRESMEAVMQIEERFMSSPGFLHASRVFLRQGGVIKMGKSHTARSEHFFLFNDLLASARSMMGKYLLKKKIPIDSTFMLGEHGPEAPAGPTRWGLLIFYHSCSCLSLYFADAAEKAAWQADLERCIAQAANTIQAGEKEKEKEAGEADRTAREKERDKEREEEKEPPYTSTSTTSASSSLSEGGERAAAAAAAAAVCALCATSFSLFNRRHWCRQCLRSVCGDCSRSRLILNAEERKPERVCDGCVLSADKAAAVGAQPQPQPPPLNGLPPSPSSSHSLSSRGRGHHYSPSASQSVLLPLTEVPEPCGSSSRSSSTHPQPPLSPHPLDFGAHSPHAGPAHLRSPSSPSFAVPVEPSPLSPSTRPYPAMRLWDEATVLRWLCEPEIGFDQFVDGFRRFHVDGPMLIELSDEELRNEIGVKEALHRKRLIKLIERLAHGPTLPPATPHAPLSSSGSHHHSNAAPSPPPSSSTVMDLVPKGLWKANYSASPSSSHSAHSQSHSQSQSNHAGAALTATPPPKLPEELARDIQQAGTAQERASERGGVHPRTPRTATSVDAAHRRGDSSTSPSSTPAMPKRAAPSLPQRQRNTAVLHRPQPSTQRATESPQTATNAGPPWTLPPPSSSSLSSSPSPSSLRCGKCGRTNEAFLRFCVSCGSFVSAQVGSGAAVASTASSSASSSSSSSSSPSAACGAASRRASVERSASPLATAPGSTSTSASRRTSGEKVSHLAAQLAQQSQQQPHHQGNGATTTTTTSASSASSSRASSLSSRPSLSSSTDAGGRERRTTAASIAQRAAAFQQAQ